MMENRRESKKLHTFSESSIKKLDVERILTLEKFVSKLLSTKVNLSSDSIP